TPRRVCAGRCRSPTPPTRSATSPNTRWRTRSASWPIRHAAQRRAEYSMSDAETLAGGHDYDRIWDEVYGDIQDLGPTHRHMTRIIRRLLAPLEYRSVLDVGVGFGH